MIKGYLQNDRGDTPMFGVFLTLVLMILLSFLLLFSTVQLRTLDLRNGIKMELNNLSARIYADTYQSQREANLPAYENRVHQFRLSCRAGKYLSHGLAKKALSGN